jgi:translation initiation factor 2 subunit 3
LEVRIFDPRLIPEVNIGMVGHVAHGKTTLVNAITGKLTLTHSEELKRGITIRLGYADATIYLCKNCGKYSTSQKCPYCFSETEPRRTVSFVDAPGHEALMATVLTGTGIMDGAIMVIAANEKCPQPQTAEHLTALEVAGIKNVIIAQTKIDLVTEEQAMKNYREIKNFVKGTILENAPIIPVSAQHRVNIEYVLEAIEKFIPTPKRDETKEPLMLVARSFDINKPGTEPEKLVGGVLGGALVQGKLKLGDKIEIRPGIRQKNAYVPLFSEVVGLQKAKKDLEEAGPGGLLGVMTKLDPSLTKSDALVGNVVGLEGKLPEVSHSLSLEVKFIREVKEPIKVGEDLLINVGVARSVGSVTSVKKDRIEIKLKIPVCFRKEERIAISRQIGGRWQLVGYGNAL